KKSLAARICAEIGARLLIVDMRELLTSSSSLEFTLRSIFRESVLRPVAIHLDHFDALLEDETKARSYLRIITACVNDFSWLTFIATERAWEPAGIFKNHRLLRAEFPLPDVTTSAQLWESLAAANKVDAGDVQWAELAGKFKFTPLQIRNS